MALNPLKQNMTNQGEIPAAVGIDMGTAQDKIAALLDGEGRAPGHIDSTGDDDSGHVRGRDNRDDDFEEESQTPPQSRGEGHDDDADDGGDTDSDEGEVGADGGDTEAKGDDDRAEDEDGDGEPITSLAEWAEALEMPVEDLLKLTHTFKASGEERTATLADLITGHRLQVDYDRDKGALAEDRRVFERAQQERVEAYQRTAQVQAQQFQLMEHFFISELQTPEMQQMQREDPTSYLLRESQVKTRLENLRRARNHAAAQYDQFMADRRQEFMATEADKLSDRYGDAWSSEMLGHAVETIKTLGFDDNEVVDIIDSRLIGGALELRELRAEVKALKEQIERGNEAAQKVKRDVPKAARKGSKGLKRGRGADRDASVSKLRRRLAQTNDVKDAAKVLEALME